MHRTHYILCCDIYEWKYIDSIIQLPLLQYLVLVEFDIVIVPKMDTVDSTDTAHTSDHQTQLNSARRRNIEKY